MNRKFISSYVFFVLAKIGFVVVKSNQIFEVLTLYNLLGEKVRSIENAERIELSGISKGLYLLEVKGSKGLWVQKIMID